MEDQEQALLQAPPVIRTTRHNGLSISMEVQTDFERHRLESFFTKEPETIRWIDELMTSGESYFDIGANVGVFTLYAALRHGAGLDVRAFEPAYHNYYRLCRNLVLNQTRCVLAYCLALGGTTSSRAMQLVSNESGSASHSFEGGDSQREGTTTAFSQGAVTIPLDTLVGEFGLPVPQHLKVDIDGYEEEFVEGARETLSNGRVKSALIEVTDERGSKERIVRAMNAAGFHTEHPLNFIEDHSRVRRRKSGNSQIENIIFVR
ncbi:MAG: hypothetical protein DRJ50_13390 [Actinobacteria bacterium]|nr:MAG: hypothetical protein DRJ50_13390 [Actinomycetota bacterium]